MAQPKQEQHEQYYCPVCRKAVADPLVCGDCMAVICRKCGTPLERDDDLGRD